MSPRKTQESEDKKPTNSDDDRSNDFRFPWERESDASRGEDQETRKGKGNAASPPEGDEVADSGSQEPAGPEVEEEENVDLTPEQIGELRKEKAEYYDRLLRTQADFDNYRKRVQKDQANLLKYGAESLLEEILPVVDNMERAVESARKHEDSNSQLREGIEMVMTQFLGVLEKLGVKAIETVGHPFDPNKHDALLRVHAPDVSDGSIVEEVRKGYYYHDKVLRPAQVTVGTHEPVEGAEPASTEES